MHVIHHKHHRIQLDVRDELAAIGLLNGVALSPIRRLDGTAMGVM